MSGDQKFIQPFSQIPTASPMIRLRVGDVIKSNYSKFGLARLFGLGQGAEAFNIQEAAQAADTAAAESARRAAARPDAVSFVRTRRYAVNDLITTIAIARDNVIFCDSSGQSAAQEGTVRRRGRRVPAIVPRENASPSVAALVINGVGKQLPDATVARIAQIISPTDSTIASFLTPLGDGANGLDASQTIYLLEIKQIGGGW